MGNHEYYRLSNLGGVIDRIQIQTVSHQQLIESLVTPTAGL